MRYQGTGVTIHNQEILGNADKLRAKLAEIQEMGYEAAELPIQGLNVIRNGKIDQRKLGQYSAALWNVPIRLTTHAPYEMNLFAADDSETELELLLASVQVSGVLGAKTMVYHVGRYVAEELFLYPRDWPCYGEEEKQHLLLEERKHLRAAGDLAAEWNLRIGMENMRPYPDCRDYCYSVIPRQLAAQVKEIDHPNVGITLDTGHLQLAANMYNLDVTEEVRRVAPYVVHMHLHDNFGKPCYSAEKNQNALIPRGRGDMHMPIGQGAVPLAEIVRILEPHFNGYIIHELRERYEAEWPQLYHDFKSMMANIS